MLCTHIAAAGVVLQLVLPDLAYSKVTGAGDDHSADRLGRVNHVAFRKLHVALPAHLQQFEDVFLERMVGAGRVAESVALALLGSWLLCDPSVGATGNAPAGVPLGEVLSILCALVFGAQICVVERFMSRPDADALRLTCVSFAVGAALCVPFLPLPTERPLLTCSNVGSALGAIAFCGFLSSGLACTLQNAGQRLVAPSVAAIVLAQESVFATLFGVLFLGDVVTLHQIAGCAFVLSAVILTQLFQHGKPHPQS